MSAHPIWLAAIGLFVAATAQAAERTEKASATTLELSSNAARISIAVQPGGPVTLRATGPAEDLDAMKVVRDGATLSISGPPARSSSSNVVIGSVTNFVTDGSVAVTRIGGGADSAPPVEFHITVPPGTRLVVDDLTGELTAGDLSAPVSISVASATVRLGDIGPADLHVEGAGEIAVAGVDGSARLTIEGSGSINVMSGTVDRLEIDLPGTGDITAAVTARHADIDFSGVGAVEVGRVLSNPTIQENGVGSVVVGR